MKEKASVSGNTASNSGWKDCGGGVYNESGLFTMEGGAISGNTTSEGGGVYVTGGTFTMQDGSISGNTTKEGGGGVGIEYGNFTMEGGTISGNKAATYGGGVYGTSGTGGRTGTFTMKGGAISGNTANLGGGVYNKGSFTMEGGTISGHTASMIGGGVYVAGGTFTMKGGEVSGNKAIVYGGGVYVAESNVYNRVAFNKTGGTFYGYDAEQNLRNTVISRFFVEKTKHAEGNMKNKALKIKNSYITAALVFIFSMVGLTALGAQAVPVWVNELEKAFPSRDWVAVTAQGTSQPQAESAAMNALARAFKTDVASLTQASQKFSQIVSDAAGKKTVSFDESKNFSQDVNTSTNVRGLIGVQTDVYRAPDKTVYVNARMNRRESAVRYSGMIRENAATINRLLADAAAIPGQDTFDVYSRLSFAYAIALVTDNFQNILEVLDPTAVNRKPGYGGANAIKTKMLECASRITIGITVDTEQAADKTLLTRAAGSFFRDLGFKTNEQGSSGKPDVGNYVLRANARFEVLTQNVISCRYYLDAAMENRSKAAVFSFTEDDRKAHPNTASEARRLAVRAAETSLKEGKFAQEFNSWLNSLLD
jgi:hypothetical protein